MDVWVLDAQENVIDMADTYESFIWTERFLGCGDFELHLPIEHTTIDLMTAENRIAKRGSDRQMIVEQVSITSDTDSGTMVKISGRSLESILERRVIARHTVLSGNLQNGIKQLLDENIISPSDTNRKIDGFVFEASTDSAITELEVEAQYLGENLYDAIYSLCQDYDIGFKVLPDGKGGFVFSLYAGVDHSYDQSARPYVVFSPKFENILSSNYLSDMTTLKTAALVGGEGEGAARSLVWSESETVASGLDRRETFTDAYDISKTVYDTDEEGNQTTTELSDEAYQSQLKQRGSETLSDSEATQAFDGEIEATQQFAYPKDFDIGDLVQVVNEFGQESKSRVSEVVYSHDVNGEALYPTFIAAQ